jgi:hypothetical protein
MRCDDEAEREGKENRKKEKKTRKEQSKKNAYAKRSTTNKRVQNDGETPR